MTLRGGISDDILTNILTQINILEASTLLSIPYWKLYDYIRTYNIPYVGREGNGKSEKSRDAANKNLKIKIKDVDALYNMYINGSNLKELGVYYGTTAATISSAFKKCGKQVKNKSGSFEPKQPKISRDILYSLYNEEKLSLKGIAELHNYPNPASVQADMDYYNIPRRSYKQAGKVLFERQPELKQLHRINFYKNLHLYNIRKTWIEVAFEEWAYKNNIIVTYQFQITPSTHRYDFRIDNTKILIELDGTFWHNSHKAKYRDMMYDIEALQAGYVVYRYTEKEIKLKENVIFDELMIFMQQEEYNNADT